MTTGFSFGSNSPGGTIVLMGPARDYFLSNNTQWASGAGSYYTHGAQVIGVEAAGSTIRYLLSAPTVGLIYQQTDFDSGEHSAQGSLAATAPLVIEAQAGSTTAVLRGIARVASNDPTWYGEPRFNYYSAIVGSTVPFEVVYTLTGTVWTTDIFTRPFTYGAAGWVDFAHPASIPHATELRISGPPRVPDNFTTSFVATATFDSGVQRKVTAKAAWTATPDWLATINAGVLTTGPLPGGDEVVTLRGVFTWGSDTLTAEKQVICRQEDSAETPGAWPMFQGNAAHTGYLPVRLDPASFVPRWQTDVGGAFGLNPVAAGEGRVFVTLRTYFDSVPTLYALDALQGGVVWSKTFAGAFSVNPPSLAYGSVYVQTGNHGNDTWLRAFDAVTGEPVFQSAHSAQWERYFAPTVYEGKVYVNGGYYGGMYGFDAYDGAQLWFAPLPQYDEWTPAVGGLRASAYVGEYTPGLYARDRLNGAPVGFAADPQFEWNGWSMQLAPVISPSGDVLAIHDGRLICFDVANGTIRWQIEAQFSGQPSVAGGRIYAVNGGSLVVLDEATQAQLWSWQAPEGAVVGPMIVTDTHVLASTTQSVHAIDLALRTSVWSFAASGHLAMADDTLYIASADGTLTAITAPRGSAADLVRLDVAGPTQVAESSSAAYRALVLYADGASAERTLVSEWSVQPGLHAAMPGPGVLTTGELIRPSEDVLVRARYTERGQTVDGALAVRISVGVPLEDLVRRNLAGALQIKQQVRLDLDSALQRERASLDVLRSLPPTPWSERAMALVTQAVCWEDQAEVRVEWSIVALADVLNQVLEGRPGAASHALPPIPCRPRRDDGVPFRR
jgi:outer membrane protein assembly factor BamB